MEKLKKIGLLCGISLLASFFLDYVGGASLMDMAEVKAILWLFPVCGAAAAFFAFKDNASVVRIAFFVSLGLWVYSNFLGQSLENDGLEMGMAFFGKAGIGGYLLVASSAIGAIFSK